MRLLTDTCAAIKLVAFGDKLFKAGVLSNGDLILHPRVFNETRKWPPYKKEKYKSELAMLASIKATSGLRPPAGEIETLETIIFSTMDEIGSPIGAADREQLVAAIHAKAEIVTNDGPFTEVAEALDVVVHTAERIVIEAHGQAVLGKEEIRIARSTWEKNNEKSASREDRKALDLICGKPS